MAYPDYSIVVIDVTVDGVTTTLSNSYFDSKVAKKIYNDAVALGHRAFLYETPTPSDFQRNDSKEIINSVSEEAVLLAAGPITSIETGDPLVDTLINTQVELLNAQYEIISYVGSGIKSGFEQIGQQTHKVYQTALGMTYSVFENIQFTASGTVLVEITVDNHTYKVKATGSINLDYETTNNCQDEGLIINSSANFPIYVTIDTIGQTEVGTYLINTIADGICGDYESTETTYIPNGTEIGSSGTITYYSNGIGGYTFYDSETDTGGDGDGGGDNDGEPCTSAGTLIGEEGPYENYKANLGDAEVDVVIGRFRFKTIANGDCTDNTVLENDCPASGTTLHYEVSESGLVTTYYKTDGACGVDVITEGSEDDGEDEDGTCPEGETGCDGYCEDYPDDPACVQTCPSEGTVVSSGETLHPLIYNIGGGDVSFPNGWTTTYSQIADGECSSSAGPEGSPTNFLPEGILLNEWFYPFLGGVQVFSEINGGYSVVTLDPAGDVEASPTVYSNDFSPSIS